MPCSTAHLTNAHQRSPTPTPRHPVCKSFAAGAGGDGAAGGCVCPAPQINTHSRHSVVPHNLQLVLAVMEQLEGAYALLIKSTHYPGELVACKRGSPLILGLRAAPKAADVASPGVGELPWLYCSLGFGAAPKAAGVASPCVCSGSSRTCVSGYVGVVARGVLLSLGQHNQAGHQRTGDDGEGKAPKPLSLHYSFTCAGSPAFLHCRRQWGGQGGQAAGGGGRL